MNKEIIAHKNQFKGSDILSKLKIKIKDFSTIPEYLIIPVTKIANVPLSILEKLICFFYVIYIKEFFHYFHLIYFIYFIFFIRSSLIHEDYLPLKKNQLSQLRPTLNNNFYLLIQKNYFQIS